MTWYRSEEGWSWHSDPSINLGTSGPARVSTDDADPGYRPRPVGFTADLGTAKPVTESHDHTEWEVVEATIHVGRCPECRDADGLHFRACPSKENR